ncbi:hypothetical protein K2173_021596 [Erythroxylum novogranatense]|uniref:RRM domain-containing protein n=1 Tax=Erythroxylum novogranatense TaxID=1862640 RepID=A0AAV8TQF8_9ROSI|nr:hypothetical protein K2173_021596 [Erythroxylum novogranatense]
MDSDQAKLFIGGISWETSEGKLTEYFSQYGDVLQTVVMRDKTTGKPRGFGFVVFSDSSILDKVLQEKHTIDGRTVDTKRALSREEQQATGRAGNLNTASTAGNGRIIRTKKIFVGGLPPTLMEEGFRQYFEAYGHVTDVVIMYDQNTQRPRGFGFISFDNEDAVDRVLQKTFHDLNGKQVEVKQALPKDSNPGGGRAMGGGSVSVSGGGYQGFGGFGNNSSSYDGRVDSNRYMLPQGSGGGYPPYGSPGYVATGYGYGPANNGIGYGGYGNYVGVAAGYGAPTGAACGNPNVGNAGFAVGPSVANRISWSSQVPSSYGGMGCGNPPSWGAPNGGAGSGGRCTASTGQSPSGATGYGSQGHGYGNYGGNDGSYGNPSGYGAAGGRFGGPRNGNVGGQGSSELQGTGRGYMGSDYNDVSGNSGYGNAGWRCDPSQDSGNYGTTQGSGPNGQVGYGGYVGTQGQQVQQQ